MIFSRNPKDRNCLRLALRQAAGEFYRGKCFIDRVERTGKQTGLLTGDYRQAVGLAQQLNVLERLCARAPCRIHVLQGIAECAAIRLMRRQNFRRARREFVMKPNG